MDWRVFFNRIKFSRTILLFMAILAIMGIVVILAGGYNIVFAFFIFLLAVITGYIKSTGLIIFWINKKYGIGSFFIIDSIINIIIMVLFGYKYVTIVNFSFCAYISYIMLWCIYIMTVYLRMIRNINYFTFYLSDKRKN